MNIRIKILHWLNHSVFKTPEGEVPTKFVRIMYRILFPLRYFYEINSGIHYNQLTDTYTINGYKFSRSIFEWFSTNAKQGDIFMFNNREDKSITITQITTCKKPQLN